MTSKYKVTLNLPELSGVVVATYSKNRLKRIEIQSGVLRDKGFDEICKYLAPYEKSIQLITAVAPERLVKYEKLNSRDKSSSTYKQCVDLYFEWYEKRSGIAPRFSGAEGKALKAILTELNKRSVDEAEALAIWKHLLSNWNKLDKFYQNQIELRQINSNLSIILRTIKNGKSGQAKSASTTNWREKV